MARNQDISFGTGSTIISDAQSPSFTCRSSFSAFLADPSTPCSASIGFSFHGSGGSNTMEFSTPVSSMPIFYFFSSGSLVEPGNCSLSFSAEISRVNAARGG